jgi:cardiolipin synthase
MTLPNVITFGRIVSVPVTIWLMTAGQFRWAFWLFVGSGVSDGLDGFIAKRFDMRSELGALLDPLADKALLVCVYVTLGLEGRLPLWLAGLVVARDVLILGGYVLLLALRRRQRIRPLLISKLNTLLQIAFAGFVLGEEGYGLDLPRVLFSLGAAVAASTLLSGGTYVVVWTRAVEGRGSQA